MQATKLTTSKPDFFNKKCPIVSIKTVNVGHVRSFKRNSNRRHQAKTRRKNKDTHQRYFPTVQISQTKESNHGLLIDFTSHENLRRKEENAKRTFLAESHVDIYQRMPGKVLNRLLRSYKDI